MGECRHVIAHWTTAAMRAQILDGIDYARRIGDVTGVSLLLMRLTQPCEARDGDLALDPDAALARLRDLAVQLLTTHPEPGEETCAALGHELAEAFAGLDTWLTNRGHPPGSWAAT